MVTFAVMGAVNWTHRWFLPGGRLSGQEIGRAFADMFLEGLRASGSPGPLPAGTSTSGSRGH
jgi:TetR/AcrR family transcriptional regulator, cholesterol catabolism regulator